MPTLRDKARQDLSATTVPLMWRTHHQMRQTLDAKEITKDALKLQIVSLRRTALRASQNNQVNTYLDLAEGLSQLKGIRHFRLLKKRMLEGFHEKEANNPGSNLSPWVVIWGPSPKMKLKHWRLEIDCHTYTLTHLSTNPVSSVLWGVSF